MSNPFLLTQSQLLILIIYAEVLATYSINVRDEEAVQA
jgi:hypothetical protein